MPLSSRKQGRHERPRGATRGVATAGRPLDRAAVLSAATFSPAQLVCKQQVPFCGDIPAGRWATLTASPSGFRCAARLPHLELQASKEGPVSDRVTCPGLPGFTREESPSCHNSSTVVLDGVERTQPLQACPVGV